MGEQKTIVISGATSGIGLETAKALARQHHRLVLIGRDTAKGDQLLRMLNAESDTPHAFFEADLSIQAQIRQVGESIREAFPTIDVLINNAAVWNSTFQRTPDAIEEQWAVNHLSYFLLTHILYDNIRRARQGRIICVGSDSHKNGKIHFDDVNLSKSYHGLRAYAQSKLANVMFTTELHKRKAEPHVATYCVQPGLVNTDIGLKKTTFLHGLVWKLRRSGGVTPAEGARTSIFLATDAAAGDVSGRYWDRCRPKDPSQRVGNARDRERLWSISEEMCRIDNFFIYKP